MRLFSLIGSVLFVVATFLIAGAEPPQQAEKPAPDLQDVRYGPHERNVLDLWKAKSDRPTSLVVFIHGGGFRTGDKQNLPAPFLKHCLAAGISVAAINYRLSQQAPFPAPMLDSARAIQYLRSRCNEWNIDPKKVAATGGSAGAGISLWIGFHDDLANPTSDDPVERQSTRLTCMAVVGAQSSYDPRFIKALIGGRAHEHPALAQLYGLKPDELDSPRAHKMYEEASAINYVSAGDPPAFLFYTEPNEPLPDDAKPGDGIHHPRFGAALKEKLEPLHIECVLRHRDDYRDKPNPMDAMYREMVEFFKRQFDKPIHAGTQEPRGASATRKAADPLLTFPPVLPGDKDAVTDSSEELLKPPPTLRGDVSVARTPPTVDFLFFPGQTYPGNPWSAWGDSLSTSGKYYASIGDHIAPQGNAFVYEYDPDSKRLRKLVDVRAVLNLPAGHYTPGKIHGRLDLGDDGWLYFATHRGSVGVTTDAYHYEGDWILRHEPATGQTEIVAHGPVPKHSIPCSVLDPTRLIFYGGTAPGSGEQEQGMAFFAFDVRARQLLYSGPHGPARSIAFARSTARVYYVAGAGDGPLMRFDPRAAAPPEKIRDHHNMRAATAETAQGFIYTVSHAIGTQDSELHRLNTKTEQIEPLGPAAVGTQQYIAALEADPTGRYVYYVPGAHGGSDADGSPVVQYDVQKRRKKVIAFLHPYYAERYQCTPRGTYSLAISPAGETLYITWNVSRGSRAWDCCALTVVHIPPSERL